MDFWRKSTFANNLEEGKSYTLHEDLSPLGLNLANDIEFEVTYEQSKSKSWNDWHDQWSF